MKGTHTVAREAIAPEEPVSRAAGPTAREDISDLRLVESRSVRGSDVISDGDATIGDVLTRSSRTVLEARQAQAIRITAGGSVRRLCRIIRGTTAGVGALLLFTACDLGKQVEPTTAPSYVVEASSPTYVVTPTSVNIQINEYFKLKPYLADGSGGTVTVTWATGNAAVATVNSYGTVRGRGNGSTTITATSSIHGASGATVNVGTAATAPTYNDPAMTATTKPEMKTVVVTPATVTVAPGATAPLSAVAKDQYGTLVSGVVFTWTSADSTIGAVSPTGIVTGIAEGQVAVKATNGGLSGTAAVTVSASGPTSATPVATTVTVIPATATVAAGAVQQLTATVRDQNGTAMTGVPVSWATANPSIATVSATGVVTGVAAGQVAIAATASGKTGSALVTVTAPPPPPAPPPPGSGAGIWISQSEIMVLPMSGSGWSNVTAAAEGTCPTPNLADDDDVANVCILAQALVYARTGVARYRDGVLAALRSIAGMGTYAGRALALGRELPAYVIAADIIGLAALDSALDSQFRAKLLELRTTLTVEGPSSLIVCHNQRPNNWGTWCGSARVAVALYLGDRQDFDRAVLVMRGWLGDRSAYSSFKYATDLSWQYDPRRRVGVNPKGATKNGYIIDGVLPEEMRRCGSFQWPPCQSTYPWAALEGALVTLWMMHRQGLPALQWSDRALLRAYEWLYGPGGDQAVGNDEWQPYLVNYMYGTSFPTVAPADPGKNIGWTDWTHARR